LGDRAGRVPDAREVTVMPKGVQKQSKNNKPKLTIQERQAKKAAKKAAKGSGLGPITPQG
jgi:hypothetical protein